MTAVPGLAIVSLLFVFLLLGQNIVGAARDGPTVFASGGTVLLDNLYVCSSVWISETVDSAGNVGVYTSLALEPTYPYTPHISYRDVTSDSLKYARLSGATWFSETVDAGCGRTSLALVPTYPHTPAISYDGCQNHTRFAWLEGTNWISKTVPGTYAGDSSLALEPTYPYTPHISYFHDWGGD